MRIATEFPENEQEIPIVSEQLSAALTELLKNAVQASPEGEDVSVSLRVEDGSLIIHITDQGSGMSRDQINRLGKLVFSSRGYGTGLGLAIAVRAVYLHGGRLLCESSEGEGTAIQLEIPLSGPPVTSRIPDGPAL
ncbi:ATP-binding protein [Alteribacter natronophilus]|uniref:ATP-binding protein n=1 Tax=Alteribacter natronophilus TaxID=2583810 RepID=UPI00110F5681|nr:ATP-binding protein [Alteribacter natronophilus]TMW71835.1 ATP-binding protein [Alteribacter natronophilus]